MDHNTAHPADAPPIYSGEAPLHGRIAANYLQQALRRSHNEPPLVVVPIKGWDMISERALRFALQLSPDVIAVHVCLGAEDNHALRTEWEEKVEGPIKGTSLPLPRLMIIHSPYRQLLKPLLSYIEQLKREYTTRTIAVVVPDLVEAHWYEYLLHNQRAAWLKADLFLHGEQRVVVINVPWYLEEHG